MSIAAPSHIPLPWVLVACCLVASPLRADVTVELTEIARSGLGEGPNHVGPGFLTHIVTSNDPRDIALAVAGYSTSVPNDRARVMRSRYGNLRRIVQDTDLIAGYCGYPQSFSAHTKDPQIDLFGDRVAFMIGNHSGLLIRRAVGWSDGGKPQLVTTSDYDRFIASCETGGFLPRAYGEFTEVAMLDADRMLISEGAEYAPARRLHLATRTPTGWDVRQKIPRDPFEQSCAAPRLDYAWSINRLSATRAVIAGIQDDDQQGFFIYDVDGDTFLPIVLSGAPIPDVGRIFTLALSCATDGDRVVFLVRDDQFNWSLCQFDLSTGQFTELLRNGDSLPETDEFTSYPYNFSVCGPFTYLHTRYGLYCHFNGAFHRILGAGDTIDGAGLLTYEQYAMHRNSATGNSVSFIVRASPTSVALQARLDDLLPGDRDADAVPDTIDNCPGVWQPDQADFDADGLGDLCDDDMDDDGVPNDLDACLFSTPGVPVTADGRPRADMNGDCRADGVDLQILVHRLLASD
ncbi:MAG TPA: thrombospondin type 3 repeat-containing protein [Phycisphaerae bacterium]|nr:thrombospondin type 3 repeat-containing protein [Phycisphaerae bacterium]